MVSSIAAAVRHYREERGLSAQRLADACKNEVGYEVPRATIVNLERGRRESVTIMEWLSLAEALNVPPVLLLYPVGRRQDAVQVLPGVDARPLDAVEYLMTRVRPLKDGEETKPGRWTTERDWTIDLFRDHEGKVSFLRSLTKSVGDADLIVAGELPNVENTSIDELRRDRGYMQRQIETAAGHLKQTRTMIRSLGLTPPELPLELRYVDEVPSSWADADPGGLLAVRDELTPPTSPPPGSPGAA